MTHEIRCANCGKVFGHSPEAPNLAPEDERLPCPDCGSKARSVSATATPDTIRAKVEIHLPEIDVIIQGLARGPDPEKAVEV